MAIGEWKRRGRTRLNRCESCARSCFRWPGWARGCCPRPRCCPRRCCRWSTGRSSSTRWRKRPPPGHRGVHLRHRPRQDASWRTISTAPSSCSRRWPGRPRPRSWTALERAVPTAGEVVYTRQQEAKGLGHAVWCARHLVGDEPFAVMLVDDLIHAETPCLAQMVAAQRGDRRQSAGRDGGAAGAHLPLRRHRPRRRPTAADRGHAAWSRSRSPR